MIAMPVDQDPRRPCEPAPAGEAPAAFRGEQETVVAVSGVRVRYGETEAVRGLDLCIHRGEIVALLGPNGAGKTSLLEVLEGFRNRSAGTAEVLGADPWRAPRSWRERLGIVLQESAPEPGLTVTEFLELYAGYYVRPLRSDAVLAQVGLAAEAGRPASALSGGQRRRLDLALALIGDPDLIFLDEPTTGFDPAARHVAWDAIRALRAAGKTVLLTTHAMDEAEALADRIVVLAAGCIAGEGPPATLGGRDRALTTISYVLPTENGRRVELRTHTPLEDLGELAAWSRDTATPVRELQAVQPTLEEIYLSLINRPDQEITP
jgi:ABC-2 type transport system ATP-binding protein